MANRYLIGTGARNWNDPLNWSETSGGAGGATVPTSGDAVILDANSGTGTITLNADANCASFDASALGAATTIAGSVYVFNCYGSFTGNTNLTFNLTGTSYFYSLGTGTITQGWATLTWNRWYVGSTGVTITNGDNCNVGSSTIFLVAGAIWDTNYFDISCYTFQPENNNTTKTIYLRSGTFTCTNIWGLDGYSWYYFNIDCGTSKIICRYLLWGTTSKTLYDVECQLTGGWVNGTLNNLSIIPLTAIVGGLKMYTNTGITVTNTLTIKGYSSTVRALVFNFAIGTHKTLSASNVVFENVDFRDVDAGGLADWNLSEITGGSGDCGGNTGITFTSAQKQYFKHTSGAVSWSDSTKWFSDEAKTTAGRVPLPQDDVQFDAGSFTGASTLTVDCPRIGKSLDMSAVNQAVTMTLANAIECYGSFVLGNNITPGGSHLLTLMGRSVYNLNLYGKTIHQFYQNAPGGTYTNLSSWTNSQTTSIIAGTFDFNDFDITSLRLNVSPEAYCYFGNGTLEFTLNSTDYILNTPGTIYSEGSTLKLGTATGSNNISFHGGGKTFNKVWLSGSHTGNFDITGSNTIAELIIDSGRKVRFARGSTQTIAKITAIGTPSAPITITSYTTTPFNLVKTGAGKVQADYLNISYSNASPADIWYAGANSVDGGNNTGWIFGVFTPILLGAFTELETMIANGLAEALIQANFTEVEEAECEVIGEALTGFDFTETEILAVEAVADAVLQVAFTEEEIMEALLIADALLEVAFTEKEWIGSENGSEGLRAYEKICGVSAFQTVISGDSDIMNNDDCN